MMKSAVAVLIGALAFAGCSIFSSNPTPDDVAKATAVARSVSAIGCAALAQSIKPQESRQIDAALTIVRAAVSQDPAKVEAALKDLVARKNQKYSAAIAGLVLDAASFVPQDQRAQTYLGLGNVVVTTCQNMLQLSFPDGVTDSLAELFDDGYTSI